MQCLGNVVGQVLGAILAVVLLRVLVPHHILAGGHLAANVLPEGSHALRAFLGARYVLPCWCHRCSERALVAASSICGASATRTLLCAYASRLIASWMSASVSAALSRCASRPRVRAAEMVGMFIVQLVFLETGTNKNSKAGALAPLVVGATYALVILAIAPISGASLNPARSLGPALLSGYFSHLWLYLLAPLCGAPPFPYTPALPQLM